MFNSKLIKEAHTMTKEIKSQYPTINYKFQFGLCLSYLLQNEGVIEMIELKGTEKQIAWAQKIRNTMITQINTCVEKLANKNSELATKIINSCNQLTVVIETQASAKWYIDNRDNDIRRFEKFSK